MKSIGLGWRAVVAADQASQPSLDVLRDELVTEGISVVEVKTLDRTANYPPYGATRAFWESSGFIQVDTIDPLPGWQPGNPSAIYVAALRATR